MRRLAKISMRINFLLSQASQMKFIEQSLMKDKWTIHLYPWSLIMTSLITKKLNQRIVCGNLHQLWEERWYQTPFPCSHIINQQ